MRKAKKKNKLFQKHLNQKRLGLQLVLEKKQEYRLLYRARLSGMKQMMIQKGFEIEFHLELTQRRLARVGNEMILKQIKLKGPWLDRVRGGRARIELKAQLEI